MTQTNLSTVQRQAGGTNGSSTAANAAAIAERYAGFEYAIQSDGLSSLAEKLWAERGGGSSNAEGIAGAADPQSSTSSSVSRRYTFHTAADGGSGAGRPNNRGRSSRGGSIVTSLAQVRQEVERSAGAYQRGEKLPDRPPPTPPQVPPPPRQPQQRPQPQQQQQQNAAAAPDVAVSTAPAAAGGGGGGHTTSAAAAIATSDSSSRTAGATVTSPRNPYSSGSSRSGNNDNLGGSGTEGNVRHKEDRDRCRALLMGSSSANGGAKSNTGNDDGVIEIGDDDEYDTGPIQFDYGNIGGSGGSAGAGGAGGGSAPATSGTTSSATFSSAPPPTFAPSTLNWHTESANDGGNHGSGTGGGNDAFDDDMFASLDVDAIVSQHQAKKQMHHQPAPSQQQQQQRYPNQGGGGGGGYQSQGYSTGSGGYNSSGANPYASASYEGAASNYGNVSNNYGGGGSNNSSSYGGGGGGFGDDFGAAGHMSLYGGGSSSNGGYQQNSGGHGNDGYGDFGGPSSGWGNSAGGDSYGGGSSSWGGGGTNHMSSAGGDESAPLCSGHGVPCRLLTASTAQNSGRQFYKCSLPEGEQCDFFEWADGMEGSLNPAAAVQGAEIKDMHTESRRKFGHHSFRVGQEGIIRNALQGRDVFVLMPTGGGKSLCYQLPAWCAPGLSVVVSPLLSLIQDQVQSMTKLGVESVFLSSAQDWETQRSQVVARIRNVTPHGGVKLLYITPEMLNRSGMMKGILSNLCKKKLISRFVVDEGKYNCDCCGRIGRLYGWNVPIFFHH